MLFTPNTQLDAVADLKGAAGLAGVVLGATTIYGGSADIEYICGL